MTRRQKGQFETAVHQNSNLTKTDKFSYLRSYLTGAAANVVAGLPLTEANYDNAIQLLHNRFGRKDLVINAHMTKLLNLNPVKNASDIKALRYLYDNCEIQIRSLASMGVVSNTYGSLLCPILMKLTPEEMTLEFSRQKDEDDVWKVEERMNFIQKEVDSRERTANMTKSAKERTSKEREKETHSAWEMCTKRSNMMTASALYASNQDRQFCFFCEKYDHMSKHCNEMSVSEKREKLKKQGRCFVCFGTRHVAKDCRTKGISCENCNRRHHKALCSYDGNESTNQIRTSDAVISVSPSESKQETVLLQTATVWIETPVKRQLTSCLLDGGSQRSFVCQDISRALNFPK